MSARPNARLPTALLEALPEPGRQLVLSKARRRSFERGERLVREGDDADSLIIVETGRVAVRTVSPGGESLVLSVLGTGAVFGEVGLFSRKGERTATVQALDEVTALVLQNVDFDRLRNENAEVNEFLLQLMARRIDRLSHLLTEALYLAANRRIARRLYEISRLYASVGSPLTLPLTQEELAQVAGTTRPTTNQVLKRLEADQVLQNSRGRIVVLDLGALRVACAWS